MCFINKMDRTGADFFFSMGTIVDRLGANAVALQIPIGAETEFSGLIDLVTMQAINYKNDDGKDWTVTEIPRTSVNWPPNTMPRWSRRSPSAMRP